MGESAGTERAYYCKERERGDSVCEEMGERERRVDEFGGRERSYQSEMEEEEAAAGLSLQMREREGRWRCWEMERGGRWLSGWSEEMGNGGGCQSYLGREKGCIFREVERENGFVLFERRGGWRCRSEGTVAARARGRWRLLVLLREGVCVDLRGREGERCSERESGDEVAAAAGAR